MTFRAAALCVLLLASLCQAHICVFSPHQRGPMNISTSGNPTCFRHGLPCGGQPAGDVVATGVAGQPFTVSWQQNYNHYSVGYSGYMSVSLASTGPNPQPSDFVELIRISDFNAHAQDNQHNFSVTVDLPEHVTCDHCVVQVIYNAHKPGESPFVQCTDIAITAQSSDNHQDDASDSSQNVEPLPYDPESPHVRSMNARVSPDAGKLLRKAWEQERVDGRVNFAYGLRVDRDRDMSTLEQIDVHTGHTNTIITFPLIVNVVDEYRDQTDNTPYIEDQLLAVRQTSPTNLVLYSTAAYNGLGSVPTYMVSVNVAEASTTSNMYQMKNLPAPINALNWDPITDSLLALTIVPVDNMPGKYTIIVYRVSLPEAGQQQFTELIRTAPDDTFVNLQWTEYNPVTQTFYVLMGDENAAESLRTRLYTFAINATSAELVHEVIPDFKQFTIAAVHSYNGKLYALSYGLNSQPVNQRNWTLVTIDPVSGAVAKSRSVLMPGLAKPHYGGNIFGGLQRSSGTLYYAFHGAQSHNSIFVGVNVETGAIDFGEQLDLDNVHNLCMFQR